MCVCKCVCNMYSMNGGCGFVCGFLGGYGFCVLIILTVEMVAECVCINCLLICLLCDVFGFSDYASCGRFLGGVDGG